MEAIAELERFVVGNDDLQELEAHIGRFNLFEALKLARVEIRHSNFLAWILDPNESHGQGSIFLKGVLMDLLAKTPPELRPFSPIEIDGVELASVEIDRERHGIDVLIHSSQPPFVVAIENKIGSGEHGNQLDRYEEAVEREFPGVPTQLVFLTTDGTEPSSDSWVPYTYSDLHRVFERIRRAHQAAIGEDVGLFLDHYLGLIQSRFMDDETIDALCRRIYRNHRRALDLIFERAGSPESELVDRLVELLQSQPERWHVYNVTSKRIDFVRRDWTELLPPVGPKMEAPRLWLKLTLAVRKGACRLFVEVQRAKETELRQRVVARLTQDQKEFGFQMRKGEEVGRRLDNQLIVRFPEEEDVDLESSITAAKKKLDAMYERTEGVAAALGPLVDSWKSARS